MVEVDFTGDYLNADNTKENDVVTILNEGVYEERTINGDKKMMLDIGVECNQKQKIYSPFDKEGQILVNAWGADTANWVGKQFEVIHMNYQGFGGVPKKKIVPKPIIE